MCEQLIQTYKRIHKWLILRRDEQIKRQVTRSLFTRVFSGMSKQSVTLKEIEQKLKEGDQRTYIFICQQIWEAVMFTTFQKRFETTLTLRRKS